MCCTGVMLQESVHKHTFMGIPARLMSTHAFALLPAPRRHLPEEVLREGEGHTQSFFGEPRCQTEAGNLFSVWPVVGPRRAIPLVSMLSGGGRSRAALRLDRRSVPSASRTASHLIRLLLAQPCLIMGKRERCVLYPQFLIPPIPEICFTPNSLLVLYTPYSLTPLLTTIPLRLASALPVSLPLSRSTTHSHARSCNRTLPPPPPPTQTPHQKHWTSHTMPP
jgi:hypothetical protein